MPIRLVMFALPNRAMNSEDRGLLFKTVVTVDDGWDILYGAFAGCWQASFLTYLHENR